MKTYTVNVPPQTKAVMRDLMLYIAKDSIDAALAWEDRLDQALQRVGKLPTGYPVDDDASQEVGYQVRKAVFERTYLIYYRLDDANQTAIIINVRHGARLRKSGEA